MSIIKNEIPILEFDTEQTAVIDPTHEKINLKLPKKCVFAFLGEYISEFLDYFKKKHNVDELFISVSLENTVARKMFSSVGFAELKEVEYTFLGKQFKEMQMVKEL